MSASKTLTRIAGAILATSLLANSGISQELRRYQPSTSTVSPYLNLGRFNTGGLPNYYSLVRPIRRQNQFNQDTQRLQRQQNLALEKFRREQMMRPMLDQQSVTGTSSQYFTNGERAVFRDTLQYYPPVIPRR